MILMIQQCIVRKRVAITSTSTIYNLLLQAIYKKLECNKLKWQWSCEQKRFANTKEVIFIHKSRIFMVSNQCCTEFRSYFFDHSDEFFVLNIKYTKYCIQKVDSSFAPAPIFLILYIGISISFYTVSVLKMSFTFTVFST